MASAILGIGLDLEEVPRIREAIERHGERFLARVYTDRERAYVENKANRYERYAARFAAKEAGMKALGTGWDRGVRWRDVEVVNDAHGRPRLEFHGRAREHADAQHCGAIHLSLSHSRGHAVAQVVLERGGE
jgi:holo-[acyl-carrier protein] synthase